MGKLIEINAGVKILEALKEELKNILASEKNTLEYSFSQILKAREARIMRFLLGFDLLDGAMPSKKAVAQFFKVSEKELEWIIYGAIFRMKKSTTFSHFLKGSIAMKTIS